MQRLRLVFAVEGQPPCLVEDHDFIVEPLCSPKGSWKLIDSQAVLRVEMSL